jgi:hypothetical protein
MATIISLQEVRREREESKLPEDQDFHTLFTKAQKLRFENPESPHDKIEVVPEEKLKDWFQHEIAAEVFEQKLFSRSVLVSIWFVSNLLTTFAKNEVGEIGITEHMSAYASDGNPEHILKAANSAFLLFVIYPEVRTGRSVHYRKLGLDNGPSLYTQYAREVRKDMGYYMAEAFKPLGEATRHRLVK